MKKSKGFTLVELLIVIVVIAILAAISITAYNGMQQRARNSARISIASAYKKGVDMAVIGGTNIQSYLQLQQYYVVGSCLSKGLADRNADGKADCHWLGDNKIVVSETGLVDAIQPYVTLPQGQIYEKVTSSDGTTYASPFVYRPDVDGAGQQLVMEYWIEGNGLDCGGLGPIVKYNSASNPAYTSATNGEKYSDLEDGGKLTVCIVKLAKQ